MSINNVPQNERPREKMLNLGPERLSNSELFAIVLNNGTKSKNVLEIAQSLIYLIDDLNELKEITLEELKKLDGIGEAKAITILAVVEIAKRMSIKNDQELYFKGPKDIYDYFYPRMKDLKQEHMYAIYFDVRGKVQGIKKITEGGTNQAFPDSKVVFKWAYRYQSSSFILVHNHPSGESYPSMADIKYTTDLYKKSLICDFRFLDHVIIGDDYTNLRKLEPNVKIFV